MFRRLLMYACFAYLLIAFGFILLAMLNAASDGTVVQILEDDAQVIVTMSVIGLFVTIIIALRMLVDSRYRRDLEQRALVPRRRSDIPRKGAAPDSEVRRMPVTEKPRR